MLSVDGFARRSARLDARASFFLKHVVAVRGEVVHLDERNLDSSVVSSIAQCYLTLVLPVKGEVLLSKARKPAFSHNETKKTRPYHSEGALWGRSNFGLFIF